jgi:Tol biopolymer transport system component
LKIALGLATAAVAVVVCSGALATTGGSLTGHIVFTATDTPFADDVMLVRSDGTRIDLSKSRASDTAPVVSPDGKHVAFFSTRGGHGAEYVVSTDGRDLRRVTPAIADSPSVAWSPSGSQLAVLTAPGQGTGAIHLTTVGGTGWRLIAGVDQPSALVGWSPDGSRIAYTNQVGGVEVVTAAGRKLHDLDGEAGAWSPSGRLAVTRDSTTVDVYDAAGKRVARLSAVSASWSPGDALATLTPGGRLQVRSHGVGGPVADVRVGDRGSIRWISATVVWLGGSLGFDVARHRSIKLPAGYSPTAAVVPTIGVAFGEPAFGKLVRSRLGGATHDVTSYATCQGRHADAFSYLQSLPDGSGAVYAGDCAPPSDVFEVRPNGSGLARVTRTSADETTVTASPDGTRLAFTRTVEAECVGCDERLEVTNAAGGAVVTIPPAAPTDGIRQDQDPSFSPDGSSIVFSRWNSSVGDAARLSRVAAAGGDATPLGVVGTAPAWGPARVAYQGPKGVATVAPDGTGNRRLAGLALADEGPVAWATNGRLAVLRTSPPLAILIPSTGRRIPLSGFSMPIEHGAGLAWSPDGTKLAFVAADRDGVGDVWTVNADGTGLAAVTHDLGAGGTLSWR